MKRQPLLIEFIGLPGAGKTTIAQRVKAELEGQGYRCFGLSSIDSPEAVEKKKGGPFNKVKTLSRTLLSCLIYREIAASALSYTLRVRPLDRRTLRRLVTLLSRLDFTGGLVRSDYDILLLDQGLLQNIWSIAVSGDPPEDETHLKRLLKSVLDQFSPLIVGVHVGADLAADRVTTRRTMRSRFDRMDASRTEPLFVKYQDVISRILSLSADIQEEACLDVNGGKPPEQNVQLIVPFIQQARPALQPAT
ncbi:MAG: hypothetical protein ACM3QS_17350 [Bacteroidota bacterium]